MKASRLTDAQKAFVIKQGKGRAGYGDLSQGWDQPGEVFQLEEEICRAGIVRLAFVNARQGAGR